MKKRLLHCIGTLGGGGAERQLAYLAPELVRRGWEVHVAFVRPGPNLQPLRQGGVITHHLDQAGFRNPRLIWDLNRLLRKVRPDLIQTWLTQMDCFVGPIAQLQSAPWIISERSAAAAYPPTLIHRFRAFLGARAAAVASNSQGGREYWQSCARAKAAQYVIPNGLPLDQIAAESPASRSQLGVKPDESLLIHVGRLSREKNVHALLIAIQLMSRKRRLRLLLCGDGPERTDIEKYLRQNGLTEQVSILGYVPSVWGLLKTADLFVSLSHFEGHPNAVMEAMACGCPIIASDIPAHRDALAKDCGLLVDPLSPQNVSDAIEECLVSDVERTKRREQALARVQRWSIASTADQYERLYYDLLHSPKARAA